MWSLTRCLLEMQFSLIWSPLDIALGVMIVDLAWYDVGFHDVNYVIGKQTSDHRETLEAKNQLVHSRYLITNIQIAKTDIILIGTLLFSLHIFRFFQHKILRSFGWQKVVYVNFNENLQEVGYICHDNNDIIRKNEKIAIIVFSKENFIQWIFVSSK